MNIQLGREPFQIGNFDYEDEGHALPIYPEGIAKLLAARDLVGMRSAVEKLSQYRSDMWQWYITRESRQQSGGKEQRLQNEREAFGNIILNMVANLNSGVVSTPEYAKAANNLDAPMTPVYANSDNSRPAASSGLLLPLAAAVAAFLYLKGH